MKKAKESVSSGGITVSVARMGHDPILVDLPKDATVADALASAGVATTSHTEYFVSGVRAETNDILDHGDVLSLTTPKQAGSN